MMDPIIVTMFCECCVSVSLGRLLPTIQGKIFDWRFRNYKSVLLLQPVGFLTQLTEGKGQFFDSLSDTNLHVFSALTCLNKAAVFSGGCITISQLRNKVYSRNI